MDPAVSCELAPAPLNHSPGDFGEHYLRQSLTDKRTFVEVKLSSGEVPEDHWRVKKKKKKYKFWHIKDRNRKSLILSELSSPPTWYCSVPSEIISVYDSPTGKSKSVWVSPWLPQLYRMQPKKPITLSPHPWLIQLGSEKRLRQQIESSEGVKGTWILPIMLWLYE